MPIPRIRFPDLKVEEERKRFIICRNPWTNSPRNLSPRCYALVVVRLNGSLVSGAVKIRVVVAGRSNNKGEVKSGVRRKNEAY